MIIGFWCTLRGPSDYNGALPTSGSANHSGLGGDRNLLLGGNGPDALTTWPLLDQINVRSKVDMETVHAFMGVKDLLQ